MNKLFSKINNLEFSYYFLQAIERNEPVKFLKIGDDVRNSLLDYISNNSIDISDISNSEFDACVELLESWLDISNNKRITFSISN